MPPKSLLPSGTLLDRGVVKKFKTCLVCIKPFTWRKKWTKDWDEVRYCSEKCKKGRGKVEVCETDSIIEERSNKRQ